MSVESWFLESECFGELGTDFSEGVCQLEESELYIRFLKASGSLKTLLGRDLGRTGWSYGICWRAEIAGDGIKGWKNDGPG